MNKKIQNFEWCETANFMPCFWSNQSVLDEIFRGSFYIDDVVTELPVYVYEFVSPEESGTSPSFSFPSGLSRADSSTVPVGRAPWIVLRDQQHAIPMRRLGHDQNMIAGQLCADYAADFHVAEPCPSLIDLGDFGFGVRVPANRVRMEKSPKPIVYVFDADDARVTHAVELFLESCNADSGTSRS